MEHHPGRLLVLLAVLSLVIPILVAVAPQASAHSSEQTARMSGKQVVGRGDRDARGSARFRSSSEITTVCYKLRFSGAGPARSAHIHQAVRGQNGDTVFTLFSKRRRSPAEGCDHNVDETLIESIQASPQSYYVDVHTAKYPKGALRGQLYNLSESDTFETCKAYRPMDDRARRAGTVIVTDGTTETQPITVKVDAPAGTSADPQSAFKNVQLTTQGKQRGLYVRYEFPQAEDYDIVVRAGDGHGLARADGFNPAAVGPAAEPNGNGGHSEVGAEQIDGLRANHCDGFTLDLITRTGAGGELVLKLWSGPVQFTPECDPTRKDLC